MDLLKPRAKRTFALPEAVVLLIYCAALAWCIPHHESWFDEAQAWLIARDSTLRDLLLHRLHYEGAPALWHLLLWIEARLHVSFLGMHYIAGLIAAAGVFVWLRFSPLPRVLVLLVPFTFYLQYQYAVIARSYNLFPLLAFGLFALYQSKRPRPIMFCIVAGLLANVALHTAAFAVGALIFYAIDRRPFTRTGQPSIRNTQRALAAGVLLFSFGIAAFVARPTPDGSFGNPVIRKIRGVLSGKAQPAPGPVPVASPEVEPSDVGHLSLTLWHVTHPAPDATHRAILAGKIIKRVLIIPTALTAPISTSNLLALAFLVLLGLNLSRQRLWLSLAPYALVLFVFVCIQGWSHHLGLLWIALLCSIWALSLEPASSPRVSSPPLRTALYAVTLVVVVLQIGWSVHCIYDDVYQAYSPSSQTAAFIRTLPADIRIASFDNESIDVNAYLPAPRYFNQRVSYWPFSKTSDPSLRVLEVMAERPDMVIVPETYSGDIFTNQWFILTAPGEPEYDPALLELLKRDGYHETHRFCGQQFDRNSSEYRVCRVIFEHNAATASLSH